MWEIGPSKVCVVGEFGNARASEHGGSCTRCDADHVQLGTTCNMCRIGGRCSHTRTHPRTQSLLLLFPCRTLASAAYSQDRELAAILPRTPSTPSTTPLAMRPAAPASPTTVEGPPDCRDRRKGSDDRHRRSSRRAAELPPPMPPLLFPPALCMVLFPVVAVEAAGRPPARAPPAPRCGVACCTTPARP